MSQPENCKRPGLIFASSYAVLPALGMTYQARQEDIPLLGLGIINGQYDRNLSDHANNEPRSFIMALPEIAVASRYHGKCAPYQMGLTQEQLFNEAISFADGDYGQQFCEYLLREQGLRLTTVDSRMAFLAENQVDIDPAVDAWDPLYKGAIVSRVPDRGYPSIMRTEDYTDVIKANPWPYDGMWERRSVHQGLLRLFREYPDTKLLDISGIYDLNCSGQSREFLKDIQDSGVPIRHAVPSSTHTMGAAN